MTAMLFSALVCAAVALRFGQALPAAAQRLLAAVVLLWALLPWPWGLHGWLESYIGYFSVSTALVALASLAQRLGGRGLPPKNEMRGFCLFVVAVAVWFYPMSLGATSFDPYAPGYGDFRFSSLLLLVGLFAWLIRAWFCCLALALAQLAYGADLLPSDNLWDYLMDPWLAFFAAGWLIRDGLSGLRGRTQPASE